MQRRAAAAYFIIFSVLAVGALGFMQVGASQPEVDLEGPTYSQGDSLTVDGRSYTVTGISAEKEGGGHGAAAELVRSGELTWFNDSAMESAELANGSTVAYRDSYEVQELEDSYVELVRTANTSETLNLREGEEFYYPAESATAVVENVTASGVELSLIKTTMVANGSTLAYEGGEYRVQIPSESEGSFDLVNTADATDNTTLTTNDTLAYQPEGVTADITAVESGNVTLQWTESATLAADETLDVQTQFSLPSEFGNESVTMTKVQNLSAMVANDPAAVNVTEGGDFVLLEDDSFVETGEYLPPNSTVTLATGDDYYHPPAGETANVTEVGTTAVTIEWLAPANETIGLEEGANITLNDQQYFVHFPNNNSVQILPNDEYYGNYQTDLSAMDEFDTRMNGLWGIVFLSLMAGIILVAAAYLPNKG
jgi:hypothetical protein